LAFRNRIQPKQHFFIDSSSNPTTNPKANRTCRLKLQTEYTTQLHTPELIHTHAVSRAARAHTYTAMDAKEVVLRGKAITKAVADGEPSSSLIKLLTDLKNGVRATEDLLRQTKIGVTVNRLRTHDDPAVKRFANEVIAGWREEVAKQKKKAQGGAPGAAKITTPSNGAAPSATPSATASPAPSKRKHNVDPATRTFKTDGIKTQISGISARDNCFGLIYNGLAFMSDEREYMYLCLLTYLF
jgi:transcription elongation factor S-II